MSYRNGTYTARILQAGHAMKRTREDEEYLRLYFQIQPILWHGPDGDYDVSQFDAQYVNFNLIRSNEDSIKYAMSDLESIGFVGTVNEFLSASWSGIEIKVHCRQSEYKGKIYFNWNIDRPKQPVDESTLSQFDRLMKKFVPKNPPKKSVEAVQPKPSPPKKEPVTAPTQSGEESPSDEIPF
ncbi:hypothetical protein EBZ39_03035 [bacterium]|nr:hypothetical protein [bacterium]